MKKLFLFILIIDFTSRLFCQAVNSEMDLPYMKDNVDPEKNIPYTEKYFLEINSPFVGNFADQLGLSIPGSNFSLKNSLSKEYPFLPNKRTVSRFSQDELSSFDIQRISKEFYDNHIHFFLKNPSAYFPSPGNILLNPGFDITGIKEKLDSTVTMEYLPWLGGWLLNYRLFRELNDSSRIAREYVQQINYEDRQLDTIYLYEYNYDTDQKTRLSSTYFQRNAVKDHLLPASKVEYEYQDGVLKGFTSYKWNLFSKDWKKDTKTELVFNDKKYIQTETINTWDTLNMVWNKSSLREYSYDPSDHLIQILTKKWNVLSENWINSEKTEYAYSIAGIRIMEQTSIWNEGVGKFLFVSRIDRLYNDAGLILEYSKSSWNAESSEWQKEFLEQIGYNQENQRTSYLLSEWRPDSLKLIPVRKTEYVYKDALLDRLYNLTWIPEQSKWDSIQRIDYHYNASEVLTHTIMNSRAPRRWEETSKTEYTFDLDGRITKQINYQWNGVEWIAIGKTENEYNKETLAKREISSWDQFAGDWIKSETDKYGYSEHGFLSHEVSMYYSYYSPDMNKEMMKYSFNENGLLDSIFVYLTDEETGKNVIAGIFVISYNDNNNILEFSALIWDEINETLFPVWKNEFTYNNNEKIICCSNLEWAQEMNSWVCYSHDSLEYNEKNFLTREFSQYWYPELGKWVNTEKREYVYDEKENVKRLENFFWYPESSDWTSTNYIENSYSSTNQLTESIEYYYGYWDETSSWAPYSRTTYTYSESGSLLDENQYLRQEDGWYPYKNTHYMYDNYLSRNEILIPYDTGFNFYQFGDLEFQFAAARYGKVISITESMINYETQNLEENKIITFYYSGIQNLYDAPNPVRKELQVYPNPASTELFVKLDPNEFQEASVTIYDLSGKIQLQRMLFSEDSIDISALKGGMYIIQIDTRKDVRTRRFLKMDY